MMAVSRVVAALLLLGMSAGSANAQAVGKDCTFKGHRLWGKVQQVNSSADIKVQIVSSFPDLKVMNVGSFPDACGKWQSVTSSADLKIQIVNSFPDIKIMYVNSFPGVP